MKGITLVLSAMLVALGLLMVVVTAAAGAGASLAVGYVLGTALAAAGGLRIMLALRRSGA